MEEELFVQRFLSRCSKTPNKILFQFVSDDSTIATTLTYLEFEKRTRILGKKLIRHRGTTALLVYPPGLDFITAFVACLRAGVIAVPVYPPRGVKNKDLSMFLSVHSSCKAKIALTNSLYDWGTRVAAMKMTITSLFRKGNEDESLGAWPEHLEWMVTDNLEDSGSNEMIDLASSKDIAFLQYTSGSTAAPKGVVLTHDNLAHNLSTIIYALKADDSTVVVSWLPMYHDMGLIGSHLGTVYCGGSATIFSPIAFVKNPPMWLELASSRKATHLQAPNFAYRLTIRKFLERKSKNVKSSPLDLKSVRHVFNAAEPIDPSAMDEFCATFGAYGFNPNAMVPGYGLAEHTVYVCDGGKQRFVVSRKILEEESRCVPLASEVDNNNNPDKMILVGCGYPPDVANIRLLIVDPKTKRKLRNDLVGEIWIHSRSKSNAYYGLEEKTKSDLQATLASDAIVTVTRESSSSESDLGKGKKVNFTDEDYEDTMEDEAKLEWLRTGDLGVIHERELFVCGRIKDMLIVRGRNHFPQDIEATVERVDRSKLRPGCSAAFTVEGSGNGEEQAVVVCEIRSTATDLKTLVQTIRTAISKEHGISVQAVVLITEHSIPKTTSGKISRHRVKAAYLNKKLTIAEIWISEGKEEESQIVDELEQNNNNVQTERKLFSPEEIMSKLTEEAASLLEQEPGNLDVTLPLIELGFDSMMITQLKGAIGNTLGAELKDEELFDERCTLTKVQAMIEEYQRNPHPAVQSVPGGAPMTEDPNLNDPNNPQLKPKRRPFCAGCKKGQQCGFCGC